MSLESVVTVQTRNTLLQVETQNTFRVSLQGDGPPLVGLSLSVRQFPLVIPQGNMNADVLFYAEFQIFSLFQLSCT